MRIDEIFTRDEFPLRAHASKFVEIAGKSVKITLTVFYKTPFVCEPLLGEELRKVGFRLKVSTSNQSLITVIKGVIEKLSPDESYVEDSGKIDGNFILVSEKGMGRIADAFFEKQGMEGCWRDVLDNFAILEISPETKWSMIEPY